MNKRDMVEGLIAIANQYEDEPFQTLKLEDTHDFSFEMVNEVNSNVNTITVRRVRNGYVASVKVETIRRRWPPTAQKLPVRETLPLALCEALAYLRGTHVVSNADDGIEFWSFMRCMLGEPQVVTLACGSHSMVDWRNYLSEVYEMALFPRDIPMCAMKWFRRRLGGLELDSLSLSTNAKSNLHDVGACSELKLRYKSEHLSFLFADDGQLYWREGESVAELRAIPYLDVLHDADRHTHPFRTARSLLRGA